MTKRHKKGKSNIGGLLMLTFAILLFIGAGIALYVISMQQISLNKENTNIQNCNDAIKDSQNNVYVIMRQQNNVTTGIIIDKLIQMNIENPKNYKLSKEQTPNTVLLGIKNSANINLTCFDENLKVIGSGELTLPK